MESDIESPEILEAKHGPISSSGPPTALIRSRTIKSSEYGSNTD